MQKLGITNTNLFYSKKEQSNIFDLTETGEISGDELISEINQYYKSLTKNQIVCAWNSMLLNLPKNRIDLLINLKKKYQIFLLSNTNEIHLNKFQNIMGSKEYNKFYNLFNKIYYSHEIGVRKPNEESFLLVLEENNLIPNEVLFIDDSPQHIEGAKKLGIQTYHLQDNEEITTVLPGIIQ